jgi:hypothetical protein
MAGSQSVPMRLRNSVPLKSARPSGSNDSGGGASPARGGGIAANGQDSARTAMCEPDRLLALSGST